MRVLGLGLAAATLAWGCVTATAARRGRPAPPAPSDCVPLELEASLAECRLPALSETSTAQADDAYRIANELWQAQDWGACAEAFDRVLDLRPSAALAAEASYGAVLCSNYALGGATAAPRRAASTSPGREPGWPPPVDLSPELTAFATRLARGACLTPDAVERSAMQYRRARLYYDHGHAREAAALLGPLALGRDGDFADVAAALWLDTLEELRRRSEPAQAACAAEVRDAAARVGARWCASGEASTDFAVCHAVVRLAAESPGR